MFFLIIELRLIITFFFTQSYSQDFGEIKLDSKLQIKYSDSLKNIGERLSGKWKYLGKNKSGILSDTLYMSFSNDKKKPLLPLKTEPYLNQQTEKRKKLIIITRLLMNLKMEKDFTRAKRDI